MSDLGSWSGPYPGQQTKFFVAPEDVVFYGGAGGGGKSLLGKMKFVHQLAHEHERFRKGEIKRSKAWGLYLRRKTPDLEQAVEESHEYFPQIDDRATFNANDMIWTFPSCANAKFQFGHMQHERDRFKYKSSAYTYVFFDELTEFEKIQFMYMQSRIRCAGTVINGVTTPDPLEKLLQCCAGSNPDGDGLLWVRDMFIEDKDPERVYRTRYVLSDGRERFKDQVFIPARLRDNPPLYESGVYEVQLRGLPPEIREAILEGNWYYASGAFLARVWDTHFHVCDDHTVPSGVKMYRSGDYGYNAPSSITWWYVDRDGVLTAFFNLYVTEHTPEQLAERIKEVEQEFGIWDDDNDCSTISGPLDSACWNKESSGTTIASKMARRGVRWYKARKGPLSRKNGAVEIISRLQARVKDHNFPDDRTKDRPMLRWMKRCTAPIKTLPILRPDPNDRDDVDTKGEDHCFVAGTVVRTPAGSVAIEDIVPGDAVVTDDGVHAALAVIRTRNVPVVRVEFDDGTSLTGTPNHRAVMADGCERPLGRLRADDTVCAWQGGERTPKCRSTTASGTTGAPTGTSGRMSARSCAGSTHYIDRCGKTPTDRFRAVMRSITSTKTARTIRSAISFCASLLSIGRITANCPQLAGASSLGWLPPGTLLAHGTPRTRGGDSTARSGRPMRQYLLDKLSSVSSADAASRTDRETGRGKCAAGDVAPHIGAKRILAITPAGRADVYNLHVSGRHRYFANGTLVLNCWDDTMYMCLARPLAAQKDHDPDEDDVDNVVPIRDRSANRIFA